MPLPPVAPYPATGEPGVATDDPLTAYRKANVYPPTSRPLTRDQDDLLHPGQRHESFRPTEHGLGLSFLFTADRYFVIGDEVLTATLEVRKDGRALPARVVRAAATVLDPRRRDDPPIALSYAPAGERYAATFAPAKLGLARQAAISMTIEFDAGHGLEHGHFDFQYTPTGGIPARFTGAFSEAVDRGSLVIRAGVEVAVAGHYLIDCNLFDAANEPVAWTRWKGELSAGRQDATLEFFGKVLVDGKARGPFHIGQLRGARYAPGEDPDLEQMPPFLGTYTTRPYPTEAFSDAEYDSPEKRRMIDLITNDRAHRGAAAGAPAPGEPAPASTP